MPPTPPPLELDDVRIVGLATLAWLLVLVGLAVAHLAGRSTPGWQYVMCLTGLVLGVVGTRLVRGRRRAGRASSP